MLLRERAFFLLFFCFFFSAHVVRRGAVEVTPYRLRRQVRSLLRRANVPVDHRAGRKEYAVGVPDRRMYTEAHAPDARQKNDNDKTTRMTPATATISTPASTRNDVTTMASTTTTPTTTAVTCRRAMHACQNPYHHNLPPPSSQYITFSYRRYHCCYFDRRHH